MTNEDTMVNVPQEGEIELADTEGNEEDTSSDSPAENNAGDEGEGDDKGEGDGAGSGKPAADANDDDKLPFHQHPRWQEREKEWQDRFNAQETRHQDDIKAVREEFAAARKENKENTEIPDWFGGTPEQWESYRKWNDQQLQSAEERALKRINDSKGKEDAAVKEATDYMRKEIDFIQGDKTLNPEGKKIDPNKLLKLVMDNDLVDSNGRWNYRAGWRMMQNQPAAPAPKPKTEDKKVIAAATTSDNKGEAKPKNFKTSDDFKTSRPW